MNERIRLLAEQATLKWAEEVPGGVQEMEFFDKEKFAGLIVRECVAICQDTDGEDNIDARSGRQDCAVEIQEHFGVEE
jgi:hypothetical protein